MKSSSSESETDAPIMADINITPLTDIFLVLLVIFMVTSSVMSQMGVQVKLPQASSKTSEAQPDGVIVTLLPSGMVQVNGGSVSAGDWNQFDSLVKAAFRATKSRVVILEGDKQAFLGLAVEVMDHARKLGAEHFSIATSASK